MTRHPAPHSRAPGRPAPLPAERRRSIGDEPTHEPTDEGSAAMWLIVVTSALLVMCGLVFDGGAALAAKGRAADVAQQAARAGADALDADTLYRGGGAGALRAQRAAAVAEARAVLAAAGVTGDATVTAEGVTVTATSTRPTAILTIIGVDEVTGTATADAVPLLGTTPEGG
jgi:Flp pilus assembly protein TadG